MTGRLRIWALDNDASRTTVIYAGGGMIASRKTYGRADVSHEDLVSSQRRVTNGLSYAQWGRDIASRWTDPRLSELTRVSHVRHGVGGGFPTTMRNGRTPRRQPLAGRARRVASRARGAHTHTPSCGSGRPAR